MNELQDEFLALEDKEIDFSLDLHLVRDQKQKELNAVNSPLKKLINDKKSGYNINTIDNIDMVTYEDKLYEPKSLQRRTLEWYHHFLNHPGGDRLYHMLQTVCYWKGVSTQAATLYKRCDNCQRHKP